MSERLSPAGQTAWARLIRAGQCALRAVEADLKRQGFPPLAWYDALLELERAPDRALRHRDLHREMLLERYNVTRLVERLAREGLVTTEPCPEDARGAVVRITASGVELRKAMWPAYRDAIERHFAKAYSERELDELAALLGRLPA